MFYQLSGNSVNEMEINDSGAVGRVWGMWWGMWWGGQINPQSIDAK